MEREITEVYCGNGKGKTTLAVGQGLRFATQGKSVIIIQFLKGRERRELDFLEELDNFDFKIFRFEKMDTCYNDLSEQEKAEERTNILNGLNFARKVIVIFCCWMRSSGLWIKESLQLRRSSICLSRRMKVCI